LCAVIEGVNEKLALVLQNSAESATEVSRQFLEPFQLKDFVMEPRLVRGLFFDDALAGVFEAVLLFPMAEVVALTPQVHPHEQVRF
jgi:hypothetical protein